MLAASNPLSTQDDVAAALTEQSGIETFAIKGEDNDTYYKHLDAVLDAKPQITMDDGADLVHVLHTQRSDQLEHVIGRHRGDHHRRDPPARDGGRGRARLSDRLGERRRHQAPVRQPVRHRPVDDGRGHARDEPPPRRAHCRRVRLRDVRARRRGARARDGRARDRDRGRPDRRARGRDGGLPGHAAARGRADRRPVHHRDRRHDGHRPRAHGAHARRRDPRQLGPLRRGDRQGGAAPSSGPAASGASASSSTSTRWPTGAGSTCSAKGGS